MLPNTPKNNQPNFFNGSLIDMLDNNDPLIALSYTMPWKTFEDSFASYYSDEGRPAKPIRLMVGLLLFAKTT
jgi:IS5 family transposase